MSAPQLTDEQASFIAGLPDVFCDLEYAISSHEFTQRVARPSVQFAKEAVRIGVQLELVDIDESGNVRLTLELQLSRDAFTESEGHAEVAELELAQQILQRLAAGGGT